MAGTDKKAAPTFEGILQELKERKYRPIYYLMGDESYYIDRIADYVATTVLTPEQRDFNQLVLFGADVDAGTVISQAKGFPMGADHRVIIVKEAQMIRDLDKLEFYLQHPQPSTVLVICHKNGTIDRRKKMAVLVAKVGVLFESKKFRDYQLPTFIRNYVRQKQCAIDEKAIAMMADFVGTDLNRMAGELDKLCIAMEGKSGKITPELVEENIGISKDFNYFELQNALVAKNVFKANQIIRYFEKNPKANPLQLTLSMLFKFYSRLLLAYYAPQKNERGIGSWIGMTEWQVKENILPAMRNYSGMKVMQIIGQIRRTDARSKGVDNPNVPDGELLKELVFFILH